MEVIITTNHDGKQQVAVVAKGFEITDPCLSECGRFTVDPEQEYGIDPRLALAMTALNRVLRGEAATSTGDARQLIPLLALIENVALTEDATGCDASLTVVSHGAAQALFDEARLLNGQSPIASQRKHVESAGLYCPQCGSQDISGEGVEVDEEGATQEVTCSACGAAWDDHFRLIGYELIEEGSGVQDDELGEGGGDE